MNQDTYGIKKKCRGEIAILKIYEDWKKATPFTCEFCEDQSSGKLEAEFLLPSYCETWPLSVHIIHTQEEKETNQ